MKKILQLILLLALSVSCRHDVAGVEDSSSRGIYYWKTKFCLSDYELDFLKRHKISRIYVKMFDVALQNESAQDTLSLIPIATTRFDSPIPDGIEIVPTVYITYEALTYLNSRNHMEIRSYADRILTRVMAMTSYHELKNVKEIQFDCDWTSSSAYTYSILCERAKERLNQDEKKLSITLRLHQMNTYKYSYPEADRGVLMLYNTGSFKNPNCSNSILSYNDVEPYIMRHDVPFPVDYAYPTYSWNLMYRDNEFKCIVRNIDLSDSLTFQKTDYNKYSARKDTIMGETQIRKGDVIRHECSEFKEIERVKSDLSRHHDMKESRQIIYHLDSTNLSKYSDDEIKYMLLAY